METHDNLLNYNDHNQTNGFVDYLAFNTFLTLILQPTKITSHSNTLTDIIFSKILQNLMAIISDHQPELAIIPNMFDYISANKSNIYEKDWLKFN